MHTIKIHIYSIINVIYYTMHDKYVKKIYTKNIKYLDLFRFK